MKSVKNSKISVSKAKKETKYPGHIFFQSFVSFDMLSRRTEINSHEFNWSF